MAINFPSSPTIGLTTTTGSKTWEWTGEGWKLNPLISAQGVQGTQGLQGSIGIGSTGFQGVQGIQGIQGSIGSQGFQGLQGTQGLQGLQGTIGIGSTGSQGTQGLQGDQGVQGLQGVGSQGSQGTQGVGSQGNQGLQGSIGIGSTGFQGAQGVQGLQGLSIQGVQGPSGSAGGGGGSVTIKDEGSVLGTAVTSINFVGSGVTATGNNTEVTVTISGGSGGSDITVQDEGSVVGSAATTFNFVGSGVAASYSGGIATITVSGGGGGSTSWSRKTANYTAVTGDLIIADTTGGTFTVTLPASPSSGDNVKIADGGDWSTTNLTVGRNGSNIEGAADNFVLDIKGIIVEFVYEDVTDGWQVYAYTGPGSSGGGTGDLLEIMLFA